MADGDSSSMPLTVPSPPMRVLDVLNDGLKAHIRNYVRDGGSRHFPTEDAQNEAEAWLIAVYEAAGIERR